MTKLRIETVWTGDEKVTHAPQPEHPWGMYYCGESHDGRASVTRTGTVEDLTCAACEDAVR